MRMALPTLRQSLHHQRQRRRTPTADMEMEVICIDSSSDDEPTVERVVPPRPSPALAAGWRGLADSGVYADAVRNALAMVSALDNNRAAPPRPMSRIKDKMHSKVTKSRSRTSMEIAINRAKPTVGVRPPPPTVGATPSVTRPVVARKIAMDTDNSAAPTLTGAKRPSSSPVSPSASANVIQLSSDSESAVDDRGSEDQDSDNTLLPAGLAGTFTSPKRVRRFKRIRRDDTTTPTLVESPGDKTPTQPASTGADGKRPGVTKPSPSPATGSVRRAPDGKKSNSDVESDDTLALRRSFSPSTRPGKSMARLMCRKSVCTPDSDRQQQPTSTKKKKLAQVPVFSRKPAPRLVLESTRPKQHQHAKQASPAEYKSPGSTRSPASTSTSPASTASTAPSVKRSRRQLEPSFNVDHITLEDLQAQEAELSRLRAEKALLESFESKISSRVIDKQKHRARPQAQATSPTVDLCSSSHDSDASLDTEETKSVKSDRGRTSVSASPAKNVQPADDGQMESEAEVSFEVHASVVSTPRPATAPAPAPTHSIVLSSSARAKWRGSAPRNCLAVEERTPFCDAALKPIHVYDATRELDKKCAFVSTFGQTQQLASSFYLTESPSAPVVQDKMDQQVRRLLTEYLPIIRRCASRRSKSATEKSRLATRCYLSSLTEHRHNVLATAMQRVGDVQKIGVLAAGRPPPRADVVTVVLGRGEADRLREFRIDRLSQKHHLVPVRPLNKTVTCIGVKRNVRVDDDPILRFLPVSTDDAQDALQAAAHSAQLGGSGEFGLPSSALDDEVAEYALRLVVKELGDSDAVFKALKNIAGLAHGYSDYTALKKHHDSMRSTERRLADARSMLEESDQDGAGAGAVALLKSVVDLKEPACKTLRERLAGPSTGFISHAVRSHVERESKPIGSSGDPIMNVKPSGEYGTMMESYRDLFCRICYIYDCQEHGIEQPQPARRVDPSYPELVMSRDVDSDEEVMTLGGSDESDSDDDSERYQPKARVPSAGGIRRSSRSATVVSTTATTIWEAQEQVRPRLSRRQRNAAQSVDPTEYVDFAHVDLLTAMMKRLLSTDLPCSSECMKHQQRITKIHPTVDAAATVVVHKLAQLVGMNSCVVAAIMKPVPCAVIHSMLEAYNRHVRRRQEWDDDAKPGGHKRSKKNSRGSGVQSSSNRELLKRTRTQRLVDRGANHAYEPCSHEGACDSTACNCLRRDHTCGKACACPRDCPNRFPGCRCGTGGCQTSSCPCVAAGRECDPDMCTTCGASCVGIFPFIKSSVRSCPPHPPGQKIWCAAAAVFTSAVAPTSPTEPVTCGNAHLQMGTHARIAIGDSSVHGFGGFAVGAIRRGEFVAEYPGEQISQDEAERRGQVYDRVSMSYLFDLNEDAVVDAIRKGNKSRFINHGSSQVVNCEAKVVQVGADHRITIWAKRDIQSGEELFFDYGYKTSDAPDWSQVRLSGTSASATKR